MTGTEEYPLPKNLFLDAKDYSPRQAKVIAHRRQSIAQLRLLQENLGKAVANLSVADSQGYMGYALDVVQGINEDITVAVANMAKANANAEQRYDAKLLEAAAPAATEVTGHATDNTTPTGGSPAHPDSGGSMKVDQGMSIHMNMKPSDIYYPRTMAEAIAVRAAKLDGSFNGGVL